MTSTQSDEGDGVKRLDFLPLLVVMMVYIKNSFDYSSFVTDLVSSVTYVYR